MNRAMGAVACGHDKQSNMTTVVASLGSGFIDGYDILKFGTIEQSIGAISRHLIIYINQDLDSLRSQACD